MHACSFGFKVLNFEKLKKLVFLISQLCGIEGIYVEEKNSYAFTSSKCADL